jgi:hypothetical protein
MNLEAAGVQKAGVMKIPVFLRIKPFWGSYRRVESKR